MTAKSALEGWADFDTRQRAIVMAETIRWSLASNEGESGAPTFRTNDGRWIFDPNFSYFDTWPGTGALLDQMASEGWYYVLDRVADGYEVLFTKYDEEANIDRATADETAPTVHEAVCLAILRVRAAEEATE